MNYLKIGTQCFILIISLTQLCLAEFSNAPITNIMAEASEQASLKKHFRMQINNVDKCTSVINNMRRQELRLGAESSVALSSLGIYYASQKKLGTKLLALSSKIETLNSQKNVYRQVGKLEKTVSSMQVANDLTAIKSYDSLIGELKTLSNSIALMIENANSAGLYKIDKISTELMALMTEHRQLSGVVNSLELALANGSTKAVNFWPQVYKQFGMISSRLATLGSAISGGSLANLSGKLANAKAAKYAIKGLTVVGKGVIPFVGGAATAYDVGNLGGWVYDNAREYRASAYPGAEYLNDYSLFDPRVDAGIICKRVMEIPSGRSILESKANDVFDGAQVGYELFRSDSQNAGKIDSQSARRAGSVQ